MTTFRFVVEVSLAPRRSGETPAEQVPDDQLLRDEIQSNIESLDRVLAVKVEHGATDGRRPCRSDSQ